MWTVTVLSAEDVAAPQSEWITVTIDLAWVDGDWRVDAVRDTPGPTPMSGPERPTVGRSAVRRRARRVHPDGRGAGRMSSFSPVLASFPNPIDWVIDKVGGFVGGAATAGFEMIIGGLVAWVIDAVVWVVGGVFSFFIDATDPNVQADWFITGDGPYATTAEHRSGPPRCSSCSPGSCRAPSPATSGGMLRRMVVDLPVSVLGMVGLVTVTQALIQLTDVLSAHVMGSFEQDISDFTTVVTSLTVLSGGQATAFVVFLLGLVTVLAGVILVAELVVREALIYIVVALAPARVRHPAVAGNEGRGPQAPRAALRVDPVQARHRRRARGRCGRSGRRWIGRRGHLPANA